MFVIYPNYLEMFKVGRLLKVDKLISHILLIIPFSYGNIVSGDYRIIIGTEAEKRRNIEVYM